MSRNYFQAISAGNTYDFFKDKDINSAAFVLNKFLRELNTEPISEGLFQNISDYMGKQFRFVKRDARKTLFLTKCNFFSPFQQTSPKLRIMTELNLPPWNLFVSKLTTMSLRRYVSNVLNVFVRAPNLCHYFLWFYRK